MAALGEHVSPELALVDPELAATLRGRALAEDRARVPEEAVQPAVIVHLDPPVPRPQPERPSRLPALAAFVAGLALGVVPFALTRLDDQSGATAVVTAPPALHWPEVGGAVSYDVGLFRDGRQVLALRTPMPSLQLVTSWRYRGQLETLVPGAYRLAVRPVMPGGVPAAATVISPVSIER